MVLSPLTEAKLRFRLVDVKRWILYPSQILPQFDGNRSLKLLRDLPPYGWMGEQIEEDLRDVRPEDIDKGAIDRYWDQQRALGNPLCLVRFVIEGGQVRRKTIGDYTKWSRPRILPIEHALKRLASLHLLPSMDFLVTLSDGLKDGEHGIPLFCFAKKKTTAAKAILIPDFEALRGNWHIFPQLARGRALCPWEEKVEKGVFRGAMTGGQFTPENFTSYPRSRVVKASLDHPDLIDGRYSALSQSDLKEEIAREFAPYFGDPLTIEDQLKFKYQLLIDGNSAAYSRTFWQMFSGCAIMKQDSDEVQWYFEALKPKTHYLPIRSDISDLARQVVWARSHDLEMKSLAENAERFANKNLSFLRIHQYLHLTLQRYGQIQNS